jgi:hypothetical protein
MKPYSVIITFIFSILLTISCEKSDAPKDNETKKIVTEYLFYDIWYDQENHVTQYIISDSSAAILQETNFEFTDSLIKESTFLNSKYSMKFYKLEGMKKRINV